MSSACSDQVHSLCLRGRTSVLPGQPSFEHSCGQGRFAPMTPWLDMAASQAVLLGKEVVHGNGSVHGRQALRQLFWLAVLKRRVIILGIERVSPQGETLFFLARFGSNSSRGSSNCHIAFILLQLSLESHIGVDDRPLLAHVSKCFRIRHPLHEVGYHYGCGS